jgi:hypothetical protein
MHRARFAVLLIFASLVSASAWSQPSGQRHGSNPPATTAVGGTYSITFNLNIESTLPASSTIVCKAQIAPAGSFFNTVSAQPGPAESASGMATVTGSTATCAVEIPFSWSVESTRNGVLLNYEIDAVNAAGSLPAVVRTSSLQGIAESYATSAGTSSISFNVTF